MQKRHSFYCGVSECMQLLLNNILGQKPRTEEIRETLSILAHNLCRISFFTLQELILP